MRAGIFVIGLISIVAAFNGCQRTSPPAETLNAAAPVNTVCPIMEHAVGEKPVLVDWNGKQVALCCDDCVADWQALSDEEKTAKMAAADAAAHSGAGAHEHGPHEHGHADDAGHADHG